MVDAFQALQDRLGDVLEVNTAGSTAEHVVIALPSYSVNESLLSHYADRIASLEHRYLHALLIPARIPGCEVIYVSTRRPVPEIVDYQLALPAPDIRRVVRERAVFVEVPDGTGGSVSGRLNARPDLIAELRRLIGGRPAMIEPWNVTDNEVALALALKVPVNGTAPGLRSLGFKSEGRRLFEAAGVPVPLGREDVRTTDDAVAAMLAIRAERPSGRGVVIKHDDSGAGDGNVVIDFDGLPAGGGGAAGAEAEAWLRARVDALPDWYRADLAAGGVVEELIAGREFSSPSAQVDIRPGGRVVVLATHEQVLGGPSGQVYQGCRFPADPGYAARLGEYAARIGEQLASRGAMGRFGVDFVASRDEGEDWRIYAIEVNLRKGGTTHPYTALRCLVPGRYDVAGGHWIAADGGSRAYSATDNLVVPEATGLPPGEVIRAVADAGLHIDHRTGTGVVLHMLSGLALDGRFGLTAIAHTPDEAVEMQEATRVAVERLAASSASARSRVEG